MWLSPTWPGPHTSPHSGSGSSHRGLDVDNILPRSPPDICMEKKRVHENTWLLVSPKAYQDSAVHSRNTRSWIERSEGTTYKTALLQKCLENLTTHSHVLLSLGRWQNTRWVTQHGLPWPVSITLIKGKMSHSFFHIGTGWYWHNSTFLCTTVDSCLFKFISFLTLTKPSDRIKVRFTW